MLYLNNQPVPVTLFPDKTSQVWKLPGELLNSSKSSRATIEWCFEHEGEFVHLAQLVDLLLEYGKNVLKLRLPYLPYARQDKDVNNNTTFALHTFANILNYLNFDQVEILDPHSEHALDWIENSNAIYPIKELNQVIKDTHTAVLCYPDKGALTKYTKEYEFFQSYIWGEKVRDQLTGNITSYKLIGDPKGLNVLIVDDICDYGRTFILLAKDLYNAGAKEVNMFVSHGLFSGGIKVLTDAGIKRIFTKNGEVDYAR